MEPDYHWHLPQRCAAALNPVTLRVPSTSRAGGSYTVYVAPAGGDCTCPGWKFHGKCKHMAHARQQICGWQLGAEPHQSLRQNIDMVCPACGGPTLLIPEEAA